VLLGDVFTKVSLTDEHAAVTTADFSVEVAVVADGRSGTDV
jgi:hypothetical protein